jgi:ABC-type transport system substrate-binding protein
MVRKLLAGVALVTLAGTGVAAAAGDTLRIAHYDGPPQFGMPYGTFGSNGAYQLYAVFDGVTFVDDTRKVNPGLALSWEARGQTTWVLKLRPNVKFHNGKPFNAQTIVDNFLAINNDPIVRPQQAANQLRGIKEAKALDELTVELTMDAPDPILPRRLHIMRPHEPQAWKDMGADQFGKRPVGTGTYRVNFWERDKVSMTAAETAWRPAKIKNVEIVVIPENAGRVQALNSGQVDLAWSLEPDSIPILERAGNKVMMSRTTDSLNLIPLHTKSGSPLADRRVRQALNYAYDKQSFTQSVLRGTAVPLGQPAASPLSGHFEDIKPYPYDPERAKRLLAEAGHPNGFKFVTEIVTATGEFQSTMENIANDFKRIGVTMEVRTISIADFVQKVLRQKQWEGDAFSMMYEGHPSADISRIMGTHSCLTRELANREPHTCFEEIMPTIKAMNVEFDDAKRNQLARQVAQFYHDHAAVIFSHERVAVDGISANLRGYKLVNRVPFYHEMTFAN